MRTICTERNTPFVHIHAKQRPRFARIRDWSRMRNNSKSPPKRILTNTHFDHIHGTSRFNGDRDGKLAKCGRSVRGNSSGGRHVDPAKSRRTCQDQWTPAFIPPRLTNRNRVGPPALVLLETCTEL